MSALDARRLRARLGDCLIGRDIVVLVETTSTNDAVLHRADAAEGFVVFAEHQSAGRGQRSSTWESAAGKGLWFSILLRPKIDISQSARLSAWAAEAVAKTVHDQFDLAATVKPPNDVYVADKKIAGVLVEMRARVQAPHLAVVGIGVDVNHEREDFSHELRTRAASLSMLLDRKINREAYAAALLRELDRSYVTLTGAVASASPSGRGLR